MKGIKNFKVGDKIYSLRLLEYESDHGLVDLLLVDGSQIYEGDILFNIDEKGIRFSRKEESPRGHCYQEMLQKVINPRFKGEKKGDLVWMIDSELFKKDYEIFYLPIKKID